MIPIDLRNYRKELRATGNMTYPVFIDIAREESWQEIHKTRLKRLAAREALYLFPGDGVAPWLPIRLLRAGFSGRNAASRRTGRFQVSAIISHLTFQSTAPFSGGGFHYRSLHALPTHDDNLPLSIFAFSNAGAAELIVSAPSALVDGGRWAQLCDAIESGVAASDAA